MTPTRMTVSLRYGSHLPVLMRAFDRSTGPVLELGMGVFSTPYLHYACMLAGRQLVSYDDNTRWIGLFEPYQSLLHDIRLVDDWDTIDLAVHWALALVDHTDTWRAHDIERLAWYAQYVIVHDTNGRYESSYHYSTIYTLFRYKLYYTGAFPSTTVLSNFCDLGDFWSGHR